MEEISPRPPAQPPTQLKIPEGAPARAPAGAERIRFVLKGLDVEGVTAYPASVIQKLFSERIGTEISLADVYNIAEEIQRFYRKDGFFLTRTVLPPQEVREGRIQIKVFEGFVSDVKVEGDIGPVESLVKAYLDHVPLERPLRLKTLERYLLLASDIPGLDVKGTLRPSPDKVGSAELVAVVERRRFNGSAVVDNFGNSFTGEYQFAGSVSANSFTSLGENLTLAGLICDPWELSDNTKNQKVVQLGGSFLPGSRGVYVRVLTAYGTANPGGNLEQFDFASDTLLLSIAGGYPVFRSRDLNLRAELGFDFINSDSDVFDDVKFSRDRIRVLHVTGIFDFRDAWRGSSFVSLGLRQGLPIFNASESGDDFLSRADGSGVFTTLRGEAWRQQPVVGHFSIYTRFAGQYAFDGVLSDEEFNVGSTRFGRGYNSKELSGDHGVGFTGELQYSRAADFARLEKYQLFGFYDFGCVWDRGTDTSVSLASAGGGVRGWFARDISVELAGAKPLTHTSQRADGSKDAQFLFRAAVSF
jgi:hemolysin activation/secretion protein